MNNNNIHKFYDYELTTEGRIKWFSYILDDFEEYIKEYWNKTQSEDWDNVPVLPESFRVEYVEKQFDTDFDTENEKRLEAFNNGEDDDNDEGWLPISHVNFIVVITPIPFSKFFYMNTRIISEFRKVFPYFI